MIEASIDYVRPRKPTPSLSQRKHRPKNEAKRQILLFLASDALAADITPDSIPGKTLEGIQTTYINNIARMYLKRSLGVTIKGGRLYIYRKEAPGNDDDGDKSQQSSLFDCD